MADLITFLLGHAATALLPWAPVIEWIGYVLSAVFVGFLIVLAIARRG